MKFGILGTGNVGDAIGSKLASLGHDVMMGSRTSGNEKALAFVAKNDGIHLKPHQEEYEPTNLG